MNSVYFERYIAAARRAPQVWRLVLGAVVVALCYLLGAIAVFASLTFFAGPDRALSVMGHLQTPDTPAKVFLLFATFPGAALGVFLAARVLHRRAPATLFGPRVRLVQDFARAAAVVLALGLAYLAGWAWYFDATPNLSWGSWAALLPLTLSALLIQTGTEELVFRGYLLQQLAARFTTPAVSMGLTAAGFAALHFDPAESTGANALVVGSSGLFGLMAADLTRVTGNIGAAWGFHFVNNLFALGFLATKGSITGLALYTTPYDVVQLADHPQVLLFDMGTTIISWAVLRRILRR